MISDTVKFKTLALLHEGPQRSTEVMRIARSRDEDYRGEFKSWVESKAAKKYRMPGTGRTATIYCLEPSGVEEFQRLKKLFLEN